MCIRDRIWGRPPPVGPGAGLLEALAARTRGCPEAVAQPAIQGFAGSARCVARAAARHRPALAKREGRTQSRTEEDGSCAYPEKAAMARAASIE